MPAIAQARSSLEAREQRRAVAAEREAEYADLRRALRAHPRHDAPQVPRRLREGVHGVEEIAREHAVARDAADLARARASAAPAGPGSGRACCAATRAGRRRSRPAACPSGSRGCRSATGGPRRVFCAHHPRVSGARRRVGEVAIAARLARRAARSRSRSGDARTRGRARAPGAGRPARAAAASRGSASGFSSSRGRGRARASPSPRRRRARRRSSVRAPARESVICARIASSSVTSSAVRSARPGSGTSSSYCCTRSVR